MNRAALLRTGLWVAVALWAGSIVWLSSLSGSELARFGVLALWDKTAHFLSFLLGALLLALALRVSTEWSSRRVAGAAIVAIATFGALDETHQRYTPQRHGGDLPDWLCDTAGAVAGTLSAIVLHARYQRKNCSAPARN